MNTFGPSGSQQYPLYDAREPRESRTRFRRDEVHALRHANHFYLPSGRWAARGWVLLDRASYNLVRQNVYSTSFQLNIADTTRPDNVRTLRNLSIVQARCVTRGLAADPNALYLVELTDDRGVLSNRWFRSPLTAMYNIRAPAYPGVFHPGSLNSGTPWTWSTMLQNIWQTMNTLGGGGVLGAWPGLPSTPTGVPEGFWFSGVSAWTALCDVLDHIGMVVACDLTQDNPYTIVVPGAADATFTALQNKYGAVTSPQYRLEDDLEWIDLGAGRVPATVLVLFRRRNAFYGTEETVRYDSLQWDMTPYYSVSVSAPAFFTGAVGSHYIWSDFTVRYDQDGVPLAADTATAAAIAQERVTQYFDVIYSQTAGSITQTYAGALPFYAGSLVDGVCWYMDPADDGGWRTRIVRGVSPPFRGVWEL